MMSEDLDEFGRKKWFYVDAIDGGKVYLIAGPFAAHQEALDWVEPVRRFADERDPRAHFMAWGTCSNIDQLRTAMGRDPGAFIAQHSQAA